MSGLPAQRVHPARLFKSTGVDYASLFQLTPCKGRVRTSIKGYVVLFICLATKAVDLEVVSNLSSEAFWVALKRFMARRSLCNNLFSDCGTNKMLRLDWTAYRAFVTKIVIQLLVELQVQWHFIPPSSPHFGGLCETGVKSIKRYLRRIT